MVVNHQLAQHLDRPTVHEIGVEQIDEQKGVEHVDREACGCTQPGVSASHPLSELLGLEAAPARRGLFLRPFEGSSARVRHGLWVWQRCG